MKNAIFEELDIFLNLCNWHKIGFAAQIRSLQKVGFGFVLHPAKRRRSSRYFERSYGRKYRERAFGCPEFSCSQEEVWRGERLSVFMYIEIWSFWRKRFAPWQLFALLWRFEFYQLTFWRLTIRLDANASAMRPRVRPRVCLPQGLHFAQSKTPVKGRNNLLMLWNADKESLSRPLLWELSCCIWYLFTLLRSSQQKPVKSRTFTSTPLSLETTCKNLHIGNDTAKLIWCVGQACWSTS